MPSAFSPARRVAALILGLALSALPALRAAEPSGATELRRQLARIFEKKEFKPKTFGPAHWMDGGKGYTTVEPSSAVADAKDIVRYDTATGTRKVFVSAARLVPAAGKKPLEIEDYSWSKDGSRLLLFTNTKKVWRRNTRGDYWVFDVADGRLRKLGAGKPESTLMFAKLSPDASLAAYVYANDLWIEDIASGKITRLTSDGSATSINGTSDWVYEEEFDVRDGFRFSPNGSCVAFWHFDSSGVGSFSLINDTDSTYPVVTTIPYPKAGTTNSAVTVEVVDAAGGSARRVELPGDPRDTYLPRMEWAESSDEIVLQQLNRLQNTNDVYLADSRTGKARRLLHDEDKAWLDVVDDWQWLASGKELVWVSEKDGWRHVWAVSRGSGAMRLLTPGNFDILKIEGVDEKAGLLYFIASPEDATRRYLYRAHLDGTGKPERVTPASLAGRNSYDIAPDGRFAIHTYSTADRPPVTDLLRLPAHRIVRVLEDNKALADAVAPLASPPTEFFQIEIGDGVTLDGWMVKPRDFDPAKKYPLLMYVYGEPAGVEVVDGWRGDRALFHRALASAGYVVACVDNRGTPAPKGRAWRKIIYGTVGVLATREQTAAVRKLLAERPYLDPDRVASWGWSGGGSMTLNLLFRSPDLYKVGMSVAPVPDQRLYDTIYQERYMGLPRENVEGYRMGSPINFAEGLEGNLLLAHGSGDDNVHFQGSERLINRLVELGKPFDFMAYPNRTHAISEGEGTSLHLHSLLARYLMKHLPAGPR
ncbi:MAG TPA: S9 family peptidase [Thermoanaerobaculia bacterium]